MRTGCEVSYRVTILVAIAGLLHLSYAFRPPSAYHTPTFSINSHHQQRFRRTVGRKGDCAKASISWIQRNDDLLLYSLPSESSDENAEEELPSNKSEGRRRYRIRSLFRRLFSGRQRKQHLDSDHPTRYSYTATTKTPVRGSSNRRGISSFTMTSAATFVSTAMASVLTMWLVPPVKPASAASAPIMAMPQRENRDMMTEMIMHNEKQIREDAQKKLDEMTRQARHIEETQGEKARIQFEKDFRERELQAAKEHKENLYKLKLDLLKQGIDPTWDFEGQRQVLLHEKGIDFGNVPGTPYYIQRQFEQKKPQKSFAHLKAANRKIIACMVQEIINRGDDPVEYFEKNQEKANSILNLSSAKATALSEQYAANLELYGQVTVPKEGEISVLERMKLEEEAKAKDPAQIKAAKEAAKQEARKQKELEKQRAKEEKQRAKEEKQRAKEEAKNGGTAAAAAAAAAGVAAAGTAGAAGAAAGASNLATGMAGAAGTTSPPSSDTETVAPSSPGTTTTGDGLVNEPTSTIGSDISSLPSSSSSSSVRTSLQDQLTKIPIVPAAAIIVGIGGGTYAIRTVKDRSNRAEEERQRQFRLLMGETGSDNDGSTTTTARTTTTVTSPPPIVEDEPKDDMDDDFLDDSSAANLESFIDGEDSKASPKSSSSLDETTDTASRTTSRGRGMKGVFGKKKSGRETNLKNLVQGSKAQAPAYATLLAQLLTFGAPGRFPDVESLTPTMPVSSFDPDKVKELVTKASTEAGLSKLESAEILANVANCMLIDIVDLASTSLKEKDDKLTAEAVEIVIDFMNHAASLYEIVAGDIVLEPVTYTGSLSRSKLEQMYGAYAFYGMMDMQNPRPDFDSRINLLQDVFQISEKKQQGLMMKTMQKNMMKALKDGGSGAGGLEAMEEMLKGMGAADGLPEGMMPPGMGENMDPETIKTMLLEFKQMKESGQVSPQEFEEFKKVFKQNFGSSIEDALKDAGPMTESDKELVEMMKSILEL